MENLLMMNIFTNTLDIYALYYFLKNLLGRSEKNSMIVALLLGIAIICSTLINTLVGLVNVVAFITMIAVLTLVFSTIFNSNKIIKVFVTLIIGLILMFIIELVVINSISIFFRIPPKVLLGINYYKLIAVVLTKSIFILITYLCRNFFSELIIMVKQLSIYPISILVIVNLLIIFMAFIFYSHIDINNKSEFIYILGMGMAAIIVSCIIAWIIKKMIDHQKKEFLFQLKEKEYENQQIYLEHIQEVIRTLRAQRHDFNNYISTIYGLIHLGKLEEAKSYIINLSKDVVDLNEIVNVYHPVVGAVLNMKKEKAARSKIEFNVDVDLPSKLPFDFVDLSIILGNLLDNAIEACEKLPNTYAKIDIEIYIRDAHMIIRIENSKSDGTILHKDGVKGYVTTKLDKENHGLGLRNVTKAVDKYNGALKIQDKGNKFLVEIALLIKESINI